MDRAIKDYIVAMNEYHDAAATAEMQWAIYNAPVSDEARQKFRAQWEADNPPPENPKED